MKKYVFNPNPPITIDQLVAACKEMQGLSRQECYKIGEKTGIAKHIVEALRQALGYTENSKRMTDQERESIAEEYENEDISIYQLAKRHGVTYTAVRSILMNRKIMIRNPNRWTKRQLATLIHEYNRGLTAREISAAMGKSRKGILNKLAQLKKEGIIKKT